MENQKPTPNPIFDKLVQAATGGAEADGADDNVLSTAQALGAMMQQSMRSARLNGLSPTQWLRALAASNAAAIACLSKDKATAGAMLLFLSMLSDDMIALTVAIEADAKRDAA